MPTGCEDWYFSSHSFHILKNIDIFTPATVIEICYWTCSWIPFEVAFVLQIATQIAVLIAKVARLDCPRQWPELIPILLESVKIQDSLQQHRALLTFYHVTKTLASKRLATDRRLFQDVSRALMPPYLHLLFSAQPFFLELYLLLKVVMCRFFFSLCKGMIFSEILINF